MQLSRRRFVVVSSTAASGAILIGWPTLAQEDPVASFRDLRGGVGIFHGPRTGGTIGWYIGADAVIVVDAKYPQFAPACIEGLAERSKRKIDVLINTHHHRDHTSGNGVFRDAVGKIVAQKNVPDLQRKVAEERGTTEEQTYADTTFDREWSIDAGDEKITAWYDGPAHTGSDAVVHFERANVVHLGDLGWTRWHPYIDVGGGASIQGWIAVLEKVLERYDAEAIYLFGHGDPALSNVVDKKEVVHQRDYFVALLERARKGIAEGKTAEQAAGEGALQGFSDTKAPSERLTLAVNLGLAYEELGTD